MGLGAVALAAGAAVIVGPTLRTPPEVSLSFDCTPGEARVYSLAYSSEGQLLDMAFGLGTGDGPRAPAQKIHAKIDGKLVAACVDRHDGEHTLAVTFENATGSLALPAGNPEEPMPALLAGTTYVTRDLRGHTKSIRFPRAMPENGRHLVRDILALEEVRLPESAAASRAWTAREATVHGAFDAVYSVESIRGEQVLLGKQLEAVHADANKLREDGPRPRAEPRTRRRGELRIHRAEHALEAADMTIDLNLQVGAKTVGTTRSTLALAQIEKRRVGADDVEARANELANVTATGGPASDLVASDIDARLDRRMQETELGGDDWNALYARTTDAKDSKTYLQMKALFILRPETCDEAGRVLAAANDPKDARFGRISGALASAGNPEAQRALVSAIRASAGRRANEHALIGALGFVKKPTAETMHALNEIARSSDDGNVRNTARFARATLSGHRADPDSPLARAVVKEEVAAYRSATKNEERTTALLALGNTGASDVLEVARAALNDPSPQVRVAAAASLRFVAAGEAEDLLVRAAANDADGSVRREAVRSLGEHVLGTPAVEMVSTLARTDTNEGVRMMAVQVVAGELERDSALEWVLDEVAQKDRARGIRNAAALVLQRHRAMRL